MHIYRERPAELSPQTYYENARYKVSKYTLIYEYMDYKIAFTTLGKCCIIYKKEEERRLRQFLVENWFLTRESLNDNDLSQCIKDAVVENNTATLLNTITNYVIITTTDCNARCYYCYEKDIKIDYLSEVTAKDIAYFIVKNYQQNQQPVHIEWFGGEPLYNENVINIICNILNENNVNFTSSIISNGILIDENKTDIYKDQWKLQSVQITLDGNRESYNKIKNYIYTDIDAFNTVINNIAALIKNNIFVTIRLNLGLDNIDELKAIIDFLHEDFEQNQYLLARYSYYVHTVFQLERTHPDKIFELKQEIDDYIINKRGGNVNLSELKNTSDSCMVNNNHSVLIHPNGKINICHRDVNKSEYIGDIYSSMDTWNKDLADSKKTYYTTNYCESCLFYPSCFILNVCEDNKSCTKYKLDYRKKKLESELSHTLKTYVLNNYNSK